MKFVLIVFIISSKSAGGVSAEFNNAAACEVAANSIRDNMPTFGWQKRTVICVPKGDDQ